MRGSIFIVGLVVLLGIGARPASAKPKTRSVTITSEPAGATVYVGDTESGSRGETPLTLDLKLGETVLVIELTGYETRFEAVKIVAGRGKEGKLPMDLSFRLDLARASLTVNEPEGARISVDGQDVGLVPTTVDVEAGSHTVQVLIDGKPPYEEVVLFVGGEESVVTPKFGGDSGGDIGDDGGDEPGDGGDDGGKPGGGDDATSGQARWTDRATLSLALGATVGNRTIGFVNSTTPDSLAPFKNKGPAPGLRLEVDLGIGGLAGIRALRPLHLIIDGGIGFPQSIDDGAVGTGLSTAWRHLRFDLRYLARVGDRVGVELGAGFINDRLTFDGDDAAAPFLPQLRYLGVRGTLGVAAKLGPAFPFVRGEYRAVLKGGILADRFATSDLSGYGVTVGVRYPFGQSGVGLRLEASYDRTSWDVTPSTDGVYSASGVTDSRLQTSVLVSRDF